MSVVTIWVGMAASDVRLGSKTAIVRVGANGVMSEMVWTPAWVAVGTGVSSCVMAVAARWSTSIASGSVSRIICSRIVRLTPGSHPCCLSML